MKGRFVNVLMIFMISFSSIILFINLNGDLRMLIAWFASPERCVFDYCFDVDVIAGPVRLRDNCIYFLSDSGPRCVNVSEGLRNSVVEKMEFTESVSYGRNYYRVFKGIGNPDLSVPQPVYLVSDKTEDVIVVASPSLDDYYYQRVLGLISVN